MSDEGTIRHGSIIWADVNEPGNGPPAGEHPLVVLSRQDEIDAGVDLRVVVCSTSFSYPLRSGWFEVPTSVEPGGHPITGLTQACVAKATWPQIVPQKNVRRVGKRMPIAIVKQIINWQRDKLRQSRKK